MAFGAIEKEFMDAQAIVIGMINESMERLRKFPVGSYLVARNPNNRRWLENGYGSKIKWVVVYTDDQGLPWAQRINKDGQPRGKLESLNGHENHSLYRTMASLTRSINDMRFLQYAQPKAPIDAERDMVFELDSGYMDSLIIGPEGYDPATEYKQQVSRWNNMVKHNKSVRIDTKGLKIVETFMSTLTVGDRIWTSSKKFFTVDAINQRMVTGSGSRKNGNTVRFIEVTYSDGKKRCHLPDDLINKQLYTAQPLSGTQLKNPNL